MRSKTIAKAIIATLVSTVFLTGCLEEKKKDESSVSDDSGDGGGGGGTPTYTCDEPNAGFRPYENGSFVTDLTPGSTNTSISFYFYVSTSAIFGAASFTGTTSAFTLAGSALGTSTLTVNTSMVNNKVKKTFTFSPAITVPSCSGVGTVGFTFTNLSLPNNSTTFFVGAQKTQASSCKATVTTSPSSMSPHAGLYSFSSEIL